MSPISTYQLQIPSITVKFTLQHSSCWQQLKTA